MELGDISSGEAPVVVLIVDEMELGDVTKGDTTLRGICDIEPVNLSDVPSLIHTELYDDPSLLLVVQVRGVETCGRVSVCSSDGPM